MYSRRNRFSLSARCRSDPFLYREPICAVPTSRFRPKSSAACLRLPLFRLVALVLAAGLGTAAGGCDNILDVYTGPQPEQVGISREEVVVRRVTAADSVSVLIVDRVRYVEAGDPYNINRVLKVVTTAATQDDALALGLQPGDRVILSTAFGSIVRQAGSLSTPDRRGPGWYEYPIGFHSITAIARTQAADR